MRITAFSVVDMPAGDRGRRLLGHFGVEVNGIEMTGCRLIADHTLQAHIVGPKWENQAGFRLSCTIVDRKLKHEMTEAALTVYRAFGGRVAAVPFTFSKDEAA